MAVAAIHILIGYALIVGMRGAWPAPAADDRLSVIMLDAVPPPRPDPPRPLHEESPKTAGGSPARRTPLTPQDFPAPTLPAPTPIVPVPTVAVSAPPPVSGGGGAGLGGGDGSGSGAGRGAGDGADFTPARQTRGSFRNSDFPASARGAGRLRIGVRYAVGPSGRIDRCEIIDPSGRAEVDAMTCGVIVDRYRFRPARNGRGVPVTQVIEEDYTWTLD